MANTTDKSYGGKYMNSNIRRIDDLGRIVIPKTIRINLQIKEGEPFEIQVRGNEIFLKRYPLLPENM